MVKVTVFICDIKCGMNCGSYFLDKGCTESVNTIKISGIPVQKWGEIEKLVLDFWDCEK